MGFSRSVIATVALVAGIAGCATVDKTSKQSTTDQIFAGTQSVDPTVESNPLKLAERGHPFEKNQRKSKSNDDSRNSSAIAANTDRQRPSSSTTSTSTTSRPANHRSIESQLPRHDVGSPTVRSPRAIRHKTTSNGDELMAASSSKPNTFIRATSTQPTRSQRLPVDGSTARFASHEPSVVLDARNGDEWQDADSLKADSFARIKSAETNVAASVDYQQRPAQPTFENVSAIPIQQASSEIQRTSFEIADGIAVNQTEPVHPAPKPIQVVEVVEPPKNLGEAIRYRGMVRSGNAEMIAQLKLHQVGMITVRKGEEVAVTNPETGKLEVLTVLLIQDGAVWLQSNNGVFPVK